MVTTECNHPRSVPAVLSLVWATPRGAPGTRINPGGARDAKQMALISVLSLWPSSSQSVIPKPAASYLLRIC